MPTFSTALSALLANSTAVDVVGNNLANLNTPGFKASVVSFFDLVTQSLGAGFGDTQVGFGVGRPITLRQFSQGAIQSTSGPLDAAIQGDGFFVIKNSSGATNLTGRRNRYRVRGETAKRIENRPMTVIAGHRRGDRPKDAAVCACKSPNCQDAAVFAVIAAAQSRRAGGM